MDERKKRGETRTSAKPSIKEKKENTEQMFFKKAAETHKNRKKTGFLGYL